MTDINSPVAGTGGAASAAAVDSLTVHSPKLLKAPPPIGWESSTLAAK